MSFAESKSTTQEAAYRPKLSDSSWKIPCPLMCQWLSSSDNTAPRERGADASAGPEGERELHVGGWVCAQ